MTEHEQLVERVATSLAVASLNGGSINDWARAAISTIAEALREPTEKMRQSIDWGKAFPGESGPNVTAEVFLKCLAASPLNGEQQ